jgi:predicted PurR-regulated permease PerM
VVVHLFEANVIVPRIMEQKVALPPVLTIASVLIMGVLLGGLGRIVAVPILAVLVVVVRHVLRGAVYGEDVELESAVLRPSGQFRIPKQTAGGIG